MSNGRELQAQAMILIETELRAMAEALHAGGDVAPGRRLRLEGVMALAIEGGGVSADHLYGTANALLGDSGKVLIESDGAVRLKLWQRRAPVWPTTTE